MPWDRETDILTINKIFSFIKDIHRSSFIHRYIGWLLRHNRMVGILSQLLFFSVCFERCNYFTFLLPWSSQILNVGQFLHINFCKSFSGIIIFDCVRRQISKQFPFTYHFSPSNASKTIIFDYSIFDSSGLLFIGLLFSLFFTSIHCGPLL